MLQHYEYKFRYEHEYLFRVIKETTVKSILNNLEKKFKHYKMQKNNILDFYIKSFLIYPYIFLPFLDINY